MGAPPPVAIGTRGTVGSLIVVDNKVSSSAGKGYNHSSFWVLLMTWKRKKRRSSSSNGFLPKMCSVSDVAETNQLDRIPGYSYRILNNEINKFQL
ncbi:uncharacterized protein G2W53_002943 [Senna tora]|uniref:Uncharacterized protein n=1 Tax=Senna tora TaxID=362788 RepID=A0A835CI02_9FABA|nr:uncharacterized protein G2W53_002943 [Senna tora]